MIAQLRQALVILGVFTLLTGIAYPLAMTGIAQLLFPAQANGSLIFRDNRVIGSQLIGQAFSDPGYFWSRPSAAGGGYDATSSSGSNLGPTSSILLDRVSVETARLLGQNGGIAVPVDLVTASASGLDPHISPAGALFQAKRVAAARGLHVADVARLVEDHTEGSTLGLLGEKRVNVLLLNLALDDLALRSSGTVTDNE